MVRHRRPQPPTPAPPSPSSDSLARRLAEGLSLHQGGQLAEAAERYRQVLAERPDHAEATYLMGVAQFQSGRPVEAEALLRRAIALEGKVGAWHTALGAALKGQGRSTEALACYDRALQLDSRDPNSHYNRGNSLQDLGRLKEAEESFRAAVALAPKHRGARTNLGLLLSGSGRADEAASWLEGVAADHPSDGTALANLALCRLEQNRAAEAETIARQAVAAAPQLGLAHYMLGQTLKALYRLEEAVAALRRAHELDPRHVETLNSLGNALGALADTDGAIAAFDRALAVDPKHVDAAFNRSLAYLLLGDYARGWPGYALRWRTSILRRFNRQFPEPAWQGESLVGKTILLYAEQGLGDTLQFIRYVPLVRARGAAVVVEAQKSLLGLLGRMPGIDALVAAGDPLPPFDVHCSIPSLPQVFQTTLETVPAAVPYLSARDEARARWAGRLATHAPRGLKIGVVWAGNPHHRNDHNRSLPLNALAPLIDQPGTTWVSLQKEPAVAQLAPSGLRIADWGGELTDFDDTAGLLAALDLLISVDTSVAHAAGALGRPVWVLLPFVPDFRWLIDRADSPWYPSAHLFRQPRIGDWQTPVEAMGCALAEWTARLSV